MGTSTHVGIVVGTHSHNIYTCCAHVYAHKKGAALDSWTCICHSNTLQCDGRVRTALVYGRKMLEVSLVKTTRRQQKENGKGADKLTTMCFRSWEGLVKALSQWGHLTTVLPSWNCMTWFLRRVFESNTFAHVLQENGEGPSSAITALPYRGGTMASPSILGVSPTLFTAPNIWLTDTALANGPIDDKWLCAPEFWCGRPINRGRFWIAASLLLRLIGSFCFGAIGFEEQFSPEYLRHTVEFCNICNVFQVQVRPDI